MPASSDFPTIPRLHLSCIHAPSHARPIPVSTGLGLAYYLRMNAGIAPGAPLAEDQVGLIVEVFRMLADNTRIRILWSLSGGELSVNDLAERLDKPAPSVSQHLAKLRMARLVRTRRVGTTIFYSLENDHVRQLVTDAVFNAEHAGPGIPSHHRDDAALRGVTSSHAHP